MGHRIIVTPRAAQDLREIQRYVAYDNPLSARRLRDRLVSELSLISDFAHAGRTVPEFGFSSIRERIKNPYRIIYRVEERRKVIHVLRFWHAARGRPQL